MPARRRSVGRTIFALTVIALAAALISAGSPPAARAQSAAAASPSGALSELISEALAVRPESRSAQDQQAAAANLTQILRQLDEVDRAALGLDDQVDYDLLSSWARARVFEYQDLDLDSQVPVRWFALGQTNRLFVRPGAVGDAGVRAAIRELQALPATLRLARERLARPARTWTENAISQAHYARILLRDYVPDAVVQDPDTRAELLRAASTALAAVDAFEEWMRSELLARSDRSPAWTPEQIDYYQVVREQLDDYPTEEMLRVAEEEEAETWAAMEQLAGKIHPSGDLRTVWENMKDEAPPWDGVLPMAQRFVDMAADWLQNEGSHVVTIPSTIDYGARITAPMGRRTLSFGGATIAPTIAGRRAGYYVLTPLEETLTDEERASRIRSYNPYWTHVISYHEWLGHVIQLAIADREVTRPMRQAFGSIYFSQAWSFYLEKLLEDEGYYEDRLDYTTGLKTRMARLQMRMWRIQRILTKIRMATGEMTFDEAVQAYIDKIGMEPTNAFIEVQRDSQSPSPPGREIIGERVILELRAEYERRMGDHYSLRNFNDTLLSYGSLPFKQIRRLMFRE
jgi:uncharacterized protein (DUF885 family)